MNVVGAPNRSLRLRRRLLPAGSPWARPLALVGMTIAGLWIVIAVAAPLLAPHAPLGQDFAPQQGPSSDTSSAPTSSAATS